MWLSMLGISWFWFYGAIFLAQFAGFARDVLGGNEHVVTFLLALFSVGIGVGSLLCERLSGRKIELGLVPLGRSASRCSLSTCGSRAHRSRRPASRGSTSISQRPRIGAWPPTSC